MMMKTGRCCELCNTIFKNDLDALEHFINEHREVALVKLSEFLVPRQYMEDNE